jgi:drug/metabolite transporter (DMT)-like permease
MPNSKTTKWAPVALMAVALVWGAAFVLMKDAIKTQPIFDFLGTRFVIAAAVMILAKPGVFKKFTKELVGKGVILGLILGISYVTQTVGLEVSTAAITGFITGLYVVMVPLLTWLIRKQKVDRKVVIGVALATVGLGFISINGLSFEVGQLWVVACAFFFAVHIFGLSVWSPGKDAYALTVVQLGTMGVICMGISFTDGYQAPIGFNGWFAILFTAVFSTAIAFFVQTWAQGIMDASKVSIYLTFEVVFTAALAVLVGQETLQLKTIFGGLLMMGAMLIVEWPGKKNSGAIVPLETFPH